MRAALRKRAAGGDLLVALAILCVTAVLALFLFPRGGQALAVQVLQDGEAVFSARLDRLEEPVQYTVEGEYPLVLELSRNGARVVETACPGEDCLHTGTVSGTGGRIICLPNRLIVTIQGDDSGYDAVTG